MMEEKDIINEEEAVKKPYNPADYPKATINDFRYRAKPRTAFGRMIQAVWEWHGIVWSFIWKWIINPLLIIFSIFMLYYAVFVIAVQSFNSSDSTTEFASFTFQNYIDMFSKRTLNDAILNTFKTSLIATLIATAVGTLIGIGAFFLPPKVKSALVLLNNIPLLNADIVTGISLMLIFSLFLPINKHFFGFWTILIAHIYFIIPYIFLSVLPKMKEIDPNMLDASLDLGVKPMKSLWKVLVPAIKGGIFSGMILAFTISFEDFVVGYFTTGNGYNTLSIWIYSSIGRKSLFPGVYAFSTALTIIMIAGIVLYNLLKGRVSNLITKIKNKSLAKKLKIEENVEEVSK